MSEVYLVWWDNGEPWEDAFRYVSGVFSTVEKAIEYITVKQGYLIKRGSEFVQPGKECPAGLKEFDEESTACEECRQYCALLDNEYDMSFMYIEEKDVDNMYES